MERLFELIVMGEPERRNFSYIGWKLEQEDLNTIYVSQENFLSNLEDIDFSRWKGEKGKEKLDKEGQTLLRSIVGKVNFINANTRPDLAYEVVELSFKFGKGQVKDLRKASRLLRKSKAQPLRIKFGRLGALENL